MKELSIEEKAKRYDEAIKMAQAKIEEAKVFDYDDEQTAHTIRLTTTDIFPELKESEDEMIRKEMIFYFQEEIPQCSIQEHSDKMREFISWLKRQEVERTKLELKAGNSYFCYKSRWERADNETFKKGLIYKCNKDGVLDNFVIKNPEQHFIEIKDERIAWLEKQGNQKPADSKIIDLDELVIELEETIGTSPHSRETIKDFFQMAVQKYMNCLRIANGEIGRLVEENYLLKEKQGEQKPVEPQHDMLSQEKYAKAVDECIYGEQKPTEVRTTSYRRVEDVERNPAAWSEEDEINLEKAIWYVENHAPMVVNDSMLVEWLKSFKDRVQSQPKQEWSEEDIVAIDCAVEVLSKDLPSLAASIERLKSLRPQNNITDEELAQTKKDAYNDALDKIEYHSGEPTFDDGWSAAIDCILKNSIIPQNTWKPSDEQMKILNEVLNFAANHESLHWNDYIFGTLNNLIRQLKKLREE